MRTRKKYFYLSNIWLYLSLLCCLSACQLTPTAVTPQPSRAPSKATPPSTNSSNELHFPPQPTQAGSTITPLPTNTPTQPANQLTIQPMADDHGRPVLAFYYPWYNQQSWNRAQMSDLPTIQYNSGDDITIDRQLDYAAGAGITGFISSWWGPADKTDVNFGKLLTHAATLDTQYHYHFASSLYIESDAPNLNSSDKLVTALSYINNHYSNSPYFFHWQGKPVLFFWDPLGNGRTLTQWSSIRQQVDPNRQMIWSAEGVNTDLLSVFDGIHLFSAGWWGLQNNTMPQVDQGFRNQINAYNQAHNTQKIWAAGVMPGYDDTRVPGRKGTFIVPRNNGATYTTSWNAAIASTPDWITITSFNEWFEGAMIEPSVTYGNQYLDLTRQFAQRWHG
ncbi:glycoside hydrolase family 99-like domain-containing protein [Dictyobacter kobayashii]|uniref:Endo-alpha-mannosidase n=1 Tax=Dictyobacter kobayashii TaxID=2014872 RepID=A0A402ALB1_9CHLR|nr:glycoside hydrolase family 99-like domain-containing protein [Dictyobacter kobayashii]GCE19916.1 hypothetical protein KDK_37160 [Dictyobacter kobayashii]